MINENDLKVSKSRKFWNFFFVFIIGISFVDNLTRWANDVARHLTGESDLFGSLFWGGLLSLNLLRVVLVTAVIGLSLTLYAYLSRSKKLYPYLILGVLICLFPLLLMSIVLAYLSITGYQDVWGQIFLGISVEFYSTLMIIQLLAVGFIAKIARDYGVKLEYFDEKDRQIGTIYGIKKFSWFLISFPTNLLITVAVTAVTRVSYVTISQLLTGKFSGGIEGLMSVVIFPLLAFGLVLWILSSGVEAIRNENLTKVSKFLRVVIFFIVIPTALLFWIRP